VSRLGAGGHAVGPGGGLQAVSHFASPYQT
jgi:hypothetical protein